MLIVIVLQVLFLYRTFQNYNHTIWNQQYHSSEVISNSNSDEGTSDSEQEKERIGNTDWCVCGGKCRPMESYTESLCCRETNEVPDEYFEGQTYQTSLIFSVTSEKL